MDILSVNDQDAINKSWLIVWVILYRLVIGQRWVIDIIYSKPNKYLANVLIRASRSRHSLNFVWYCSQLKILDSDWSKDFFYLPIWNLFQFLIFLENIEIGRPINARIFTIWSEAFIMSHSCFYFSTNQRSVFWKWPRDLICSTCNILHISWPLSLLSVSDTARPGRLPFQCLWACMPWLVQIVNLRLSRLDWSD